MLKFKARSSFQVHGLEILFCTFPTNQNNLCKFLHHLHYLHKFFFMTITRLQSLNVRKCYFFFSVKRKHLYCHFIVNISLPLYTNKNHHQSTRHFSSLSNDCAYFKSIQINGKSDYVSNVIINCGDGKLKGRERIWYMISQVRDF